MTANAIDLRNQGMISSSTFGSGDANSVTVRANTLSADGGGCARDSGGVCAEGQRAGTDEDNAGNSYGARGWCGRDDAVVWPPADAVETWRVRPRGKVWRRALC